MKIEFDNPSTAEADFIAHYILPKAINLFFAKNRDYKIPGINIAEQLGVRGQWADMYRKVAKLKQSMWEQNGEGLEFETAEEVIYDLIGHCLLALNYLNTEKVNAAKYAEDEDEDEDEPRNIGELVDRERGLVSDFERRKRQPIPMERHVMPGVLISEQPTPEFGVPDQLHKVIASGGGGGSSVPPGVAHGVPERKVRCGRCGVITTFGHNCSGETAI